MARGDYVVLKTFPSRSSPGTEYEVRRGGDGTVYCTCPQWRFKQGRGGCKHLAEWKRRNAPARAAGAPCAGVAGIQVGDVLEVNDRGVVFLLLYTGASGQTVRGRELLDAGEAASSLRAEREVDRSAVVRVVRRHIS